MLRIVVQIKQRAPQQSFFYNNKLRFIDPTTNRAVGSLTNRQDSRFGPRSDPKGEGHGWPESISPGAPYKLKSYVIFGVALFCFG